MNVVLRWFTRILIIIVVVAIALTATAIVYGRIAEWRLAAATRIETPNGIESLETVELGGVEQTIYLRGHDRNNPVMLFLHGGPGVPEMPLARDFGLQLEEHFVVVHWDQRGAGNSCISDVPDESLNLEQYLLDTVELVNLLRSRFGVEKLYLVGHSWGSILGVMIAERHPELFYAYVGMGQVVNMDRGEEISYRFVLDRAKAEGNEEALEELATIHPPYATTQELLTQRAWLSHYHGDIYEGGGTSELVRGVLFSPEYPIGKKLSFYGCAINSVDQAWGDLQDFDFIRDVPRLDVPVYFFAGRHDYNTPFELVEEFSSTLEAPHNEIVWFENSAHSPNLEESDLYQDILINKVLPETIRGQGS
jgi:pimeloyl-ACP methyl ester carboxylesterase